MNLIGKIFVVLILVMSVVFMAFAMAVYATHKNWMTEDLGLKSQLDDAKAENKKLTDQADSLKKQSDKEKAEQIQAVAKLENEYQLAKTELQSREAKVAELEKAKRTAEAAMNSTQANATDYRKELEGQRATLEDARKDRDAHFKEVVRVTEELNQAANEKDLLKKRTTELGKDLAKAEKVLRQFGYDKNKDYSNIPPVVDGVVLATPGAGLVEVSLGSDDGLMKGHKLEVYRSAGGQSTYVGRIEVVKTDPSRAVCKIDPKFQNSNVMVGDRVASKID